MKPEDFTEELSRDDKNIVLVTPETKKKMDEAQEWFDKHFGPGPTEGGESDGR